MTRRRRRRHRLRADRPPAGRTRSSGAACRVAAVLRRRCATQPHAPADASRGPTGIVAPSADAAIAADGVDLVVVATTHAPLAPIAVDGGRRPAATCSSRSPAPHTPRRRRAPRQGGAPSAAWSCASATTTASTRRSAGPRSSSTSGRYGPLLHVRARYGHGGRLGYEREWRARRELSGGGELLDQGSHLIDLTRHLVGDVELAFSELRTEFWDDGRRGQRVPRPAHGRRRLRVAPRQLVGVEEPVLVRDHAARRQDRDHRSRRLLRAGAADAVRDGSRSWVRPTSRRWEWPPGDDSWSARDRRRARPSSTAEPASGAGIDDAVATFRIIDEAYAR